MSRKPFNPMERYSYIVDLDTVTREQIIEELKRWGPPYGSYGGSPRQICGLLHQIAILKGFDPITPEEVVRT